jgi:hypothetical protein
METASLAILVVKKLHDAGAGGQARSSLFGWAEIGIPVARFSPPVLTPGGSFFGAVAGGFCVP